MKLLFRGKDLPSFVALGYTVVELLAVVALASGISLSVLALSRNEPELPYRVEVEPCRENYWHTQQQLDEVWMFGELGYDQCARE